MGHWIGTVNNNVQRIDSPVGGFQFSCISRDCHFCSGAYKRNLLKVSGSQTDTVLSDDEDDEDEEEHALVKHTPRKHHNNLHFRKKRQESNINKDEEEVANVKKGCQNLYV